MFLKIINYKFLIPIGLVIYAFLINFFTGNIGVMPIDTFGFFDTGYSILKNKLPIRDFWIFTGLVVDYLQALFFLIFGLSWKSYIFHSSAINVIATLSFYFFLKNFNLNNYLIVIYCISFATLCYPVSGTPFAYLHSYVFSLVAIFLFCIALNNQNNLIWLSLPFVFFLAFFSMQTPSFYIIFIILVCTFYYFLKFKKLESLKFFLLGSLISILFFLLFLFLTKTPLKNLFYEYFLFPITIGEGRLASDASAYVRFSDQLNFKRIFGDFKFIHIFLFPLLYLFIISIIKKNQSLILTNIVVIVSVIFFIFNQLNQANQIYIFSLIPVLASLLNINITNNNFNKKFILFFIVVLIFSTAKYHFRYNVERKFLDIENKDKSLAISAERIDKKLKNLKWLSPNYENPEKELNLISLALEKLKLDNRNKILITHYQFFSLLTEQDLNILNRWYLWDNNTHPTENHKYFSFYKKLVNENVEKNDIKVIYLLGANNEMPFSKINNYFESICFKNYTLVENNFSQHEIIECKN